MKHNKNLNNTTPQPPSIDIFNCPHCKSTSIIRNGFKKNKQQYKCKQCNKNFQATTGTPTHWLHLRNKITIYVEALMKGMTIRASAKYVGISNTTSFNWRHKLLSSINNESILKDTQKASAISIIKTPYSSKGRKKEPEKIKKNSRTIIIKQGNQINIQILNYKNITKQIKQSISSKIIIPAIKNRELTTIAKKISSKQIIKQKLIINKLKNEISLKTKQLNVWMKRFHGVATKYLQQYWNWFCGLNNVKILQNEIQQFYESCTSNHTLYIYKQLKIK